MLTLNTLNETLCRRLQESITILTGAVALFLLMALVSYHADDPSWSTYCEHQPQNIAGLVGAWCADIILYGCGYIGYILPGVIVFWGSTCWSASTLTRAWRWYMFVVRLLGHLGILLSVCALATLSLPTTQLVPYTAGGLLGELIVIPLSAWLNYSGAALVIITSLLLSLTLGTHFSWYDRYQRIHSMWRAMRAPKDLSTDIVAATTEPLLDVVTPPKETLKPSTMPTPADQKQRERTLATQLMKSLQEFGVEAVCVATKAGPVVTLFEFKLAPGTKASKVSGLTKDLARSISVAKIRVVEIISGKSVIGIEVPNQIRQTVELEQILRSTPFINSTSKLTLALGQNIAGQTIVADLAKMPHLLVAGTTGAGKSVCLNTMLLSLLQKCTPTELRLVLIDPKVLELAAYENLPHLLAPVVTDTTEAQNALLWCVAEMERRYQVMAAVGVRNIDGFNTKVGRALASGNPIPDPITPARKETVPTLEPLPYIVIVIDELADLMMATSKKVESPIVRITQKARAAGLHMIVATQRPSVDVITGLIKANIPTRIAFQVPTKIDSRTVLDQMGAENLLGKGDMLYLPLGTEAPIRVHGAYISDEQLSKKLTQLKKRYPQVSPQVTSFENTAEEPIEDPLYDQAVRLIKETKKVSVSHLQRHLRIGYNRAANLVESMEAQGVISKLQANGFREILLPE